MGKWVDEAAPRPNLIYPFTLCSMLMTAWLHDPILPAHTLRKS